jgi:hypothetical protein
VRVTEPAVLPQLLPALPAGARLLSPSASGVDHLVSFVVGGGAPGAATRRFHLLYAAAHQFLRSLDRAEALRILGIHLERAVAEIAPRRLFVHAGVVGYKGRAIVIPGPSGSGKTRLVAALLDAGAEYYSDEYAVIDGAGRVHPFARPLDFEESGARRKVPARELGAVVGSRPLPLGLIAVTRYEPGARFRPVRESPGRAALDVVAHTVMVRKRVRDALATVESVVPAAARLKGVRGEAKDAVPRLLAALEGERA